MEKTLRLCLLLSWPTRAEKEICHSVLVKEGLSWSMPEGPAGCLEEVLCSGGSREEGTAPGSGKPSQRPGGWGGHAASEDRGRF